MDHAPLGVGGIRECMHPVYSAFAILQFIPSPSVTQWFVGRIRSGNEEIRTMHHSCHQVYFPYWHICPEKWVLSVVMRKGDQDRRRQLCCSENILEAEPYTKEHKGMR